MCVCDSGNISGHKLLEGIIKILIFHVAKLIKEKLNIKNILKGHE